MRARDWTSTWHVACLIAGILSPLLGAAWLLVVDGILSEGLTQMTSLGVALLLPALLPVVWRQKPIGQRVVGILIGLITSWITVLAIITLVEWGHTHY